MIRVDFNQYDEYARHRDPVAPGVRRRRAPPRRRPPARGRRRRLAAPLGLAHARRRRSGRQPAREPRARAAGAALMTPSLLERQVLRTRNGLAQLAGLNDPVVAQTPRDLVWRRDS